jgi:uncharacterized membrane-anchored protein YitT (DUF2179 family)
VQAGFSAARSALILSTNPDVVREAILGTLERGVTVLHGQGGYSGEQRPVLYVVVSPHEVGRLKRLVAQVDPAAFVAITPAQEVLGEGFAPHAGEEESS